MRIHIYSKIEFAYFYEKYRKFKKNITWTLTFHHMLFICKLWNLGFLYILRNFVLKNCIQCIFQKNNENYKKEGTHRVRTHAILLLTLTVTLTFQPKTTPLVRYPKVIPYTKFEHSEIIHFWVMLCLLVWKCTYWPCDLDLSTPKPSHFYNIPR